MIRFVSAFLLLCAWLNAAVAAAQEPITRYVLENGLEVVLAPDERVPKVVTNLSYRVGALNEPPGRAGFAHLFEHLMFSGTDSWSGLFTAMEAIGVNSNAWTWEDKTLYYLEGVSSTLPVLLSIEADRMANLGRSVDQRELDLQRAVVKNEMRQNVIDAPAQTGWTVAWSALFPKGHPYSKTVLGSLADLDAASLDDVRGFFNTYYVPNNAILVVVGDFDVEDTKSLIADTFGRVPRGADVPRPAPEPTEPTRARVEVTDRLPTPDVGLLFTGPAYGAKENGALMIAAELLGNPDYGVLRNRLIATGLAISAYAEWSPGYLGGRFFVEGVAAEGVSAAKLEAELRSVVSDFLKTPLDPADVERARKSVLQATHVKREPLKDRAEAIAELTDMLGKPELAFQDDARIADASVADVESAVRAVLKLPDASAVTIEPGPRGDFPPLLTDSTGEGAPFTAAQKPAVDIPKLAEREPQEVKAPVAQTAELSNGIKVIHYSMPASPMTYVAAVASGGWSSAPAGKEGIFELASMMAWRGAGARDYDAFAKAAKDIGASIGSKAGHQATMITLSVPPEALDQGASLLADAVRAPRFDESEWDLLVAETMDWLAWREADLPDVAYRTGKSILFPRRPGQPYFDWTRESLEAITLEDTKAAFDELFNPAGLTLVTVGAGSLDTIAASLEKAFGSWREQDKAIQPVAYPPAAFPETMRVVLLPEPGASQTAIMVARPVPGLDEVGHTEAEAVMRLLGDDFTSRLNSVIREEKGYSYGVYGHLLAGIRNGSAMVIETTVERDNSGPALAEFFRGFESLADRRVEEAELERTISAFRRGLASLAETSGGLFATVTDLVGDSRTLEERFTEMEAITNLSIEAVRKQASALSSVEQALIVLAGDPDVVLPQLRTMGLTEVEVIERHDVASRDVLDEAVPPLAQLGKRDGSTRSIHSCWPRNGCARVRLSQ